jgi:hypothetical protein
MRRLTAVAFAVALAACATKQGTTSQSSLPGHGALSITIVPNPIVAKPAGGSMYDFPFDVVIRETGGKPVMISRVTTDVYALGGAVKVASETHDASKIVALGYPTTVAANGELRYHFAPRKSVTDDRLFGGVTGEVTVEGNDSRGTSTTARVSVTVTR